ncbi:MAG: hypothetical protein NVS2B12_03650 [Ktedonobacteraceae bacterium]
MIYYRIAFRVEQALASDESLGQVLAPATVWKWRSTLLSSPYALFTLLRVYHYVPKEDIRIFFASSEDEMDEMLARQNMGQLSNSVSADQFLSRKNVSVQDVKRLAMELSTERDHDTPYIFTLPIYLPERLAWLRLLGKVRRGELKS